MALSAIFTIAGIKLSTMIAAAGGAVVSLGLVRGMSFSQAVAALIGGTLCSVHIAPMLTGYFDLSPQYENGVVFLTGVMGMNMLGGLVKLSEKFKNNPLETIDEIRRRKSVEKSDG